MCTASYPAAVSPLTANAGCAADPVSSCQCVCCRACSVAAFSKNSNKLTAQADCSSSARTRRSQISRRSYNGLRRCALANGVVYAKRPFAGPAAVLAYLSRYTHRVAISNSRLLALDERGVTFRYKDYRAKGKTRYKAMTLSADEFIRRFLLHVLPSGFHRIRHYGLLANAGRREHLARARELLQVPLAVTTRQASTTPASAIFVCPHCGAAMRVVQE